MKSFGSDNNSGVHPEIFKAIVDANVEHAVGYGADPWTERALEVFSQHFGSEVEVAFSFNGTGANVIAVALGAKSFNSIICAEHSHINVDECGAPEKFAGCKLVGIRSDDGKLRINDISQQLAFRGDEHRAQPSLVSISQSNEFGLVYSIAELKALCDYAHGQGLYVHMDGARLANAAAALGVTLRQVTRDVGIDLLSFGGTKNGMMYGEAVVVFNKQLSGALKYIRKQSTQLASKMRFISAQFTALLSSDLWLRNAKHANSMANEFAVKLGQHGLTPSRPVQSNMIFLKLPRVQIDALQKSQFFYVTDEQAGEIRLVTSFDTQTAEIDNFIAEMS